MQKFEIRKVIFKHKELVIKELLTIVDSIPGRAVISETLSNNIVEKLRDFVTQGKMFRSCLFLSLCEVLQRVPDRVVYNIAASFELMQAALLIFDDIMDRSELRRHQPAFHVAMRTIDEYKYSFHDAEGIASCVAMALILLAHECFSAGLVGHSSEVLLQLTREFDACYFSVGFGQVMDIRAPSFFSNMNSTMIHNLHKYKTARYTVTLPIKTAGIYCGVAQPIVTRLGIFGDAAGQLFQLQDDLLDITGKQEALGKPLAGDVLNEKANFVLVLFKDLHGLPAWEELCAKIERGEAQVGDIYTKAVEQETEQAAKRLLQSAKEQLHEIHKTERELAELLDATLHWISTRDA